ncbi:hypothetical protein GOBAR_AA18359 [Gossypium barbadense]|uniref:Pentatricopeptide repeat-containing protein n=1 Tax=Gossypium barbadense TaxID=3634 RepID=A0A2P5XG62_GOSBA|nr:hypothetical protein GOBAR_AA18359 [Gossypium barbadense]
MEMKHHLVEFGNGSFPIVAAFSEPPDHRFRRSIAGKLVVKDKRSSARLLKYATWALLSRITVGLSKMIKLRHGYLLSGFSDKFCPSFLVRIMNIIGTRETAFAFFRFAFRDDSEDAIRSSCTVAHILASQNLRYLAQDVVSWYCLSLIDLIAVMLEYHDCFFNYMDFAICLDAEIKRSLKKSSNAQGGQYRLNSPVVSSTESSSSSAARTKPNGAHLQPQLLGASDASIAGNAAQPVQSHTIQNSTRPVSNAPTSQPAAISSDTSFPSTSEKEDASKAFSLQFGSITPGFMNGMQVPARTSSAPPNLDEQKCNQARHHSSFKCVPNLPIPIPRQQLPRKDSVATEQSSSGEVYPVPKIKKDAQPSSVPPANQTQKPSPLNIPMTSMQMPFHHQPHVPIQYGGPNPQIQSQSVTASSMQMPMHISLAMGNGPQVQQQVFVAGLQALPLPPQGMMHQGGGLSFTPSIGGHLPPQLGNLGMGITPQYSQQQGGKFGVPRKTTPVKITHPDTHEELRLDKRTDTRADGGSSVPRPHPNMPIQSQPIPSFAAPHSINYYSNSYNTKSGFYLPPSSRPLASNQIAPNTQGPRFNNPGSQGHQNISFMNSAAAHGSLAVNKSVHLVRGSLESANVEKNLRYLAQDVVSWVIRRIGETRSEDLVEFMWEGHYDYESDFSVLDTLMRAFLNAGMGTRALGILCRMRDVGAVPSSSAMTTLFEFLLRVGDYGSVWKMFRDMIREGPCPSNYTFNAMILGFCRKGHLRTAESLLNVMGKYKCNPDVCGYNILINANCIRGWTSSALGCVQLMIERGCTPSIFTFNIIVNALCSEGNVVEARKVLNEIQEIGLSPNVTIYNTLINGHVKARDVGQANMLYEELRSKGIIPDAVTFNILVAGHFKFGRKEDGDRLLRELLVMDLLPDHSLCDISVAGLCWAGRLDEALEILENMLEKGMRPSVVAFNSVIAAYSRAGLEEDAYKVFKLMMKFSLTPSSSTCSSLLMGLSRKGRLEEAREHLYKMMHKGFPINKVAFTVLLEGYFRKGDLAGAKDIWNEMQCRGIYPDTVAFSAFINGLSKAGLIEEAYDLFLEMSGKGLMPNNFVYNSLIAGFCNLGRINEAQKLRREMKQNGLVPDIFTFNIIINGFCKHATMKSAFDAFIDMHCAGLVPDIVTYNTLIGGYCEAFDMVKVNQFMNNMYANGWEPDITTYNIRIHGFCSSRKMNRAVMMLDELLSAGVVPDSVTYNTMMNGVCKDILDRAMIITAKLLKMAFIPNVITTNVLLSHFCKQGMPRRALMWCQKLSEISFEFDQVSYKIMDQAYRNIHEDIEFSKATSGKSLLLEFLISLSETFTALGTKCVELKAPQGERRHKEQRYRNYEGRHGVPYNKF